MIEIRQIRQEDNADLARLIRNTFIEFDAPLTGTVYEDPTTDALYELFHASAASALFVAVKDHVTLGCCGIYPTQGLPKACAELVKFYLSPSARGKGIGKTLFERSIEEAKTMGYQTLYIESQPSFQKAVKMYEQYGFRYLDHALGNSGHDNCNIWMLKDL